MTDNQGGFPIPPAFWNSLSKEEFLSLTATGILPKHLVTRLWHMTDRQGAPSGDVEILLNRHDVEQMIKRLKKQQKKGRPT